MSVPVATVISVSSLASDLPKVPDAVPVFSEESEFAEKVARKSAEPMLLLDTTGSMTWPASNTSPILRKDLAKQALLLVVKTMQELDTAGKDEEGGGGLMVTTFAGGHGKVVGDINPANFEKKWKTIHFDGGTHIVPGWNTMLDNFDSEHGKKDKSDRPLKLVTLITDGEADDLGKFTDILAKDTNAFVVVILIGCHLPGVNHQAAIDQFTALAAENPRVVFSDFTDCVDPQRLADQILLVCGQATA